MQFTIWALIYLIKICLWNYPPIKTIPLIFFIFIILIHLNLFVGILCRSCFYLRNDASWVVLLNCRSWQVNESLPNFNYCIFNLTKYGFILFVLIYCFISFFCFAVLFFLACDEWKILPKPNLHRDVNRFGHSAVVING